MPRVKIQAPDRTRAERGTLTADGAVMMPEIPPVIESSGSKGSSVGRGIGGAGGAIACSSIGSGGSVVDEPTSSGAEVGGTVDFTVV